MVANDKAGKRSPGHASAKIAQHHGDPTEGADGSLNQPAGSGVGGSLTAWLAKVNAQPITILTPDAVTA